MSTLSFWLDTPSACGLVEADASGTVIGGCPYFRKAYRGRPLNEVVAGLRRLGRTVRWKRLAADTGVVVVVFGGRDYGDREAGVRRAGRAACEPRDREGARRRCDGR